MIEPDDAAGIISGVSEGVFYTWDELSNLYTGIITSRKGHELYFSCAQAQRFILDYSMPTGTAIFFAFSDNGTSWFSLDTNGNAVKISGEIDYFRLSEFGNTPAQLEALRQIPAFDDKKIYVMAALSASSLDGSLPRFKLSVNAITTSQISSVNEYSPVYDLDGSVIRDIEPVCSALNNASISLMGNAELTDGTSTGWLPLDDLKGLTAKTLQFRGTLNAPILNASIATLDKITVSYSEGAVASSDGTGDIITLTEDWYMNISQVRVNVRHSPLNNSGLNVYAAFRKAPAIITNEQLGIGSGSRKVFQLAHTGGIRYDTVRVYFDGVQVFSDWELNGEVGRITCTAPSGSIVTCSYEYGWDLETWRELSLVSRISLMDWDESEYRLDAGSIGCSVGALKFSMSVKSGSIGEEVIGKGTGTSKTYRLTRNASAMPTVTANGSALSRMNYTLLDDPKMLRVAAPSGSTIRASYNWVGDTPKIYQFMAVFSD